MTSETDLSYMLQVIELGEEVKGTTGDNPWVGCLIIKEDQILGRGATQPPGGFHAEAAAISDALEKGHSLEGSTLYCSVEPCSFKGRTPSCAEAIVRSGIERVVAAILDPHPKVNGEGFRILKEAGIEVNEGPGALQAEAFLKEWLDSRKS